jgi:16S rRNA (cytosine967-C5)-methyltransferase
LCSPTSNEILATLSPELDERIANTIDEKLAYLEIENVDELFPCVDQLSESINKEEFLLSHLVQPDLFLRIRPGHEKNVYRKLSAAGLEFKKMDESIVSLPSSTKIEEILMIDNEVVIQDISSQRVGAFFKSIVEVKTEKYKIEDVWDACAASGGKSIMIHDLFPAIRLIVSDVRESIIVNLKKRFSRAGIKNFESKIIDLSSKGSAEKNLDGKKFDLVIADVPCSGSGTWGRAPENLFHFDCERIEYYAGLQSTILREIASSVKEGGLLLYVTCSVYRKENEEQVELLASLGFEILGTKILEGIRSDAMWVAVGRKMHSS